jgi:type I restriction enzyme M protein
LGRSTRTALSRPWSITQLTAAGTSGFLIEAGEYIRKHHPEMLRNKETRDHFHNQMFHGFEFDPTMLRIGAMNMTLHGIENPDISYRVATLRDPDTLRIGRLRCVLALPVCQASTSWRSCAAG